MRKLELSCRKSTSPLVRSLDPEPKWTLGDLFSELNSLETHIGLQFDGTYAGAAMPQIKQRVFTPERSPNCERSKPAFVMNVSEDETSEEEENACRSLAIGSRFSCNDDTSSDGEDSDNEDIPSIVMHKKPLEEYVLSELESEHQIEVKELLRSKLSSFEVDCRNENDRANLTMLKVDQCIEARKNTTSGVDRQFKRHIAELLDRHISAIQREHEQQSQIVERKIRDDVVLAEATRRANEERTRQAKAIQEAETKMASMLAEEARKAREAEEKKATEKEAARITVSEVAQKASVDASTSNKEANTQVKNHNVVSQVGSPIGMLGFKVLAAEGALDAEQKRLHLLKDMPEISFLMKEFGRYDRQIAKSINKLIPTVESVKARAQEIVQILNDPVLPRPASFYLLANKIVSICRDRNTKDNTFENTAFACGYVILLITSQVPGLMEILLAVFHKACIYTVPKYLKPSESVSQTKEYFKILGYQENDGKLESAEAYNTYVASYMKLYAAMIQTEVGNFRNPHGLREGWQWLARFLNTLPANTSTAFAMESFLKMAGFALHQKYNTQFMKILDVISSSFLLRLKEHGSKVKAEPVKNLEHYLENKIFLKEPEGRRLATALLSREFAL